MKEEQQMVECEGGGAADRELQSRLLSVDTTMASMRQSPFVTLSTMATPSDWVLGISSTAQAQSTVRLNGQSRRAD
jgi:hypothetical protein